MNTPHAKELESARAQARAQFESIREMVERLRAADAGDDETERDDARQAIHDDALSVEVRSGWYVPGARNADTKPAEYKILLCTGGPAVQIVGELNEYSEPETARIQYQDWFTPWTDWRLDDPKDPNAVQDIEPILLVYAQTFYFGE